MANITHQQKDQAIERFVEILGSIEPSRQTTLIELFEAWRGAENQEQRSQVAHYIKEFMNPPKEASMPLDLTAPEKPNEGLQKWITYISARMVTVRKQKGMTQQQLAEKSSIPQSHISRLEAGKHCPNHLTIKRLAEALGVAVGELDPSGH